MKFLLKNLFASDDARILNDMVSDIKTSNPNSKSQ